MAVNNLEIEAGRTRVSPVVGIFFRKHHRYVGCEATEEYWGEGEDEQSKWSVGRGEVPVRSRNGGRCLLGVVSVKFCKMGQ